MVSTRFNKDSAPPNKYGGLITKKPVGMCFALLLSLFGFQVNSLATDKVRFAYISDSMRSTARSMLNAKGDDRMIPFVISDRWEDPEVKTAPLFSEVFRDEDNRRAFNTWNVANQFSRPFTLSPGTPKDRVNILRKAFKATIEDADYIADAKKSKLTVEYVSGEEAEKLVDQIYSMPPQVKERLNFTVRKRGQS